MYLILVRDLVLKDRNLLLKETLDDTYYKKIQFIFNIFVLILLDRRLAKGKSINI